MLNNNRKNISLLLIGDPHFKEKGVTRYAKMSEEILSNAQKMKPDLIVILGDTLHKHESAHQAAFDMANQMIIDLSAISHTVLLIGNHDYCNNQQFLSDKHFFNPLKQVANVTVVDKPTSISRDGFNFGFCPYVFPGRFHEALATYFTDDSLRSCDVIFAHQEILGVQMGSVKSEVGDPWPSDYPLLILGHIHEYNELHDNVIYVGTPIQHNFGDSSNKGIYQLLFDSNNYSLKRIKLNVPMKKVIKVTADKVRSISIPNNAEVKVVISATLSEYNKLEKEGVIEKMRNKGVIVIHQDVIIENKIDVEVKETFLETLRKKIKDDEGLIKRYDYIFTK